MRLVIIHPHNAVCILQQLFKSVAALNKLLSRVVAICPILTSLLLDKLHAACKTSKTEDLLTPNNN
jgi:hypothetical protein